MRKVVLILLVTLCWIGAAYSQVRTGNIYGTILDENNAPIPGVTVTLKSAATGTTLTAITTTEGNFRFLSVPPGKDFVIRCELQGFETILRKDIVATVGANTSLNFTMKLGKVDTVVEVIATSPLIDTMKPAVAANVTRDTLQELPTARDPWVVLQLAPGVMVDRENIGGNESGQQSNFSGRGDSGNNSQWNVDGVNISDPAALGASPMYFDFDMFEEMQIQTAANDVTSSTGGVNINFVTKRGGDKFSGGARFYYDNKDLQNENATQELKDAGLTGNRVKDIKDYGANFGGPLFKSKLWFWGAAGVQNIQLVNITGALDKTDLKTYNLKFNAQLKSHRLEFYFVYSTKIKDGRRRGGGYLDAIESTWLQTGPGKVFKFQDEFTVGKNLFFSGKISRVPMGFSFMPKGGLDTEQYRDIATNIMTGTNYYYMTNRPMWYGDFSGDYFKENLLGANHEFKFGVEYKNSVITSVTQYGNGGYGYLNAGVPYRARIFSTGGEKYFANRFSLFAQDIITKGKLSLNLGVRLDRQVGGVTDYQVPATNVSWSVVNGVDYQMKSFLQPKETFPFKWNMFSPRLGVTYDFSGNGKTVVRANFSIYGSTIDPTYAFAFFDYGANTFKWNDTSGDKKIQSNELTFDAARSYFYWNDLIRPQDLLDSKLQPEKTAEFLGGFEREVAENLAVGVNYIYRKMYSYNWGVSLVCRNADTFCVDANGQTVSSELSRITNDDWDATWTATIPGYGDFTIWDFNYNNLVYWSGGNYFTKQPDYNQTYSGLEFTLKKRLSKKWMADASLTLQTWKAHYGSRNGYQDPTNHEPVDYLNNTEMAYTKTGSGAVDVYMNSKWMFKLGGMYQLPYDFNISGTLIGRQGYILPLQGTAYDVTREIDSYYEATIWVEKFGSTRLPNMFLTNLRIEKLFNAKKYGKFFISFDIFNVANSAVVLAKQNDVTYENFGQTLQIMSPRLFRIGLRYEF